MWTDLLSALALVFIIEGIMPFLNPNGLKRIFAHASRMQNSMLRITGLCSMLFGLAMLYLVRA